MRSSLNSENEEALAVTASAGRNPDHSSDRADIRSVEDSSDFEHDNPAHYNFLMRMAFLRYGLLRPNYPARSTDPIIMYLEYIFINAPLLTDIFVRANNMARWPDNKYGAKNNAKIVVINIAN